MPIACLILGLFAFLLAFSFQGLSRQYGLLVTLGAFFLYYSILSVGMALAEGGALDPAMAVWFPNIFFTVLGALGLWLAGQERGINFWQWGQNLWLRIRSAST